MKNRPRMAAGTAVLVCLFFLMSTHALKERLMQTYDEQFSRVVSDRNGEIIRIFPNDKGYYATRADRLPDRLRDLLKQKEDRWFYWHPGINPLSIARDMVHALSSGTLSGSSTLTQQLVKILPGNEDARTLKNKIVESLYAVSLELWTSKQDILSMYASSAYFGKQRQGIAEAAEYFFHKPPEALNDMEVLQLLAALNNPSYRYPGSARNRQFLPRLAAALGVATDGQSAQWPPESDEPGSPPASKTSFEIETLGNVCRTSCRISIDRDLTEHLRDELSRTLALPSFAGARHGAIVVIKLPENELLAMVGSPNPLSQGDGDQINMAMQPRPIGSTVKPFIYLKAFEKGARPYTLVEDREEKYTIGTGFEFYPRNFDGKYRGTVTLHTALSNSLNVPSVKTLEFVGVPAFSDFLTRELGFKPLAPLADYQLGIALGGLEMDLLTLAHYFTIFPQQGVFKPLSVGPHILTTPMESFLSEPRQITDPRFIQLVNSILSDRTTGVDQFGLRSPLNLPSSNYALKTGTSRDFHDSWTIGYTPDFLVGVWLGNSDNAPMQQISGQTGAGRIWHSAMEMMLNSSYNKHTPFDLAAITQFSSVGTIEYGLDGDNYERARAIMQNDRIVISPHDGDVFAFEPEMTIPLETKNDIDWYIDGQLTGRGKKISWKPAEPGTYHIGAKGHQAGEQSISITVQAGEK